MLPDSEIAIEYLRGDRGETVCMRHLPSGVAASFSGSPDQFQLWRLRRRLELEVRRNNRDRIVTSLPLRALNGSPNRSKGFLTIAEIKAALRSGPVSFVIVNIGDPLDSYDPADAYRLWKGEIKDHLIERSDFYLGDLKDEYGYLAYAWPDLSPQVISLEKQH